MEKMKILVFDDNETNLAAAKAQLKGHDVIVVGTYDEAQKLVVSRLDWKKQEQILAEQFGDFKPWNSDDEEKKKAYYAAKEATKEQATRHPEFDVVLADLLVPASGQQQCDEGYEYVGKEMPVGVFIALLAAKNGVKYAAAFTDSNHHDHPASACFDAFNNEGGEKAPTPFTLNGCKVILCNNRNWVNDFDPSDLARPLRYEEYKRRTDTVRAKNWASLLNYLVLG